MQIDQRILFQLKTQENNAFSQVGFGVQIPQKKVKKGRSQRRRRKRRDQSDAQNPRKEKGKEKGANVAD